ncbi:MAG: hypothetical protein ACRD3T_09980 [Terriglobia bacterium]
MTCRLFHERPHLGEPEFELLAGAIQSRRAAQGLWARDKCTVNQEPIDRGAVPDTPP